VVSLQGRLSNAIKLAADSWRRHGAKMNRR
jgi:hypothetical protein